MAMQSETGQKRQAAPKTITQSFGFMPGIDLDKLGQLADELEVEAFAALYWVFLGQNPPEIAYWERGEWWPAGDPSRGSRRR